MRAQEGRIPKDPAHSTSTNPALDGTGRTDKPGIAFLPIPDDADRQRFWPRVERSAGCRRRVKL